jgi:hypothetical protein
MIRWGDAEAKFWLPVLMRIQRADSISEKEKDWRIAKSDAFGIRIGEQFRLKPGAGETPVAVSRRGGDPERLGDLVDLQSREIKQLDDFSVLGVIHGQLFERFVEGQKAIGVLRSRDIDVFQRETLSVAAAFKTGLSTGILDQNPPQRFGSRRKKMATAVPAGDFVRVHES